MKLQFEIRRFKELSLADLYHILQLRSEVFVVEQDCVYQDIDGKDEKALHVLGMFDDKIIAYSRLFAPGFYFDNASIGRVVVSAEHRHKKWGHELIQESINGIAFAFGKGRITISAQLYLRKFYESHGFIQEGEGYLEDGIPHIKMNRD